MIEKLALIIVISIVLKAVQGRRLYYQLPFACVYVAIALNVTLFDRVIGNITEISVDILYKYTQMFTTGWWGSGQYIAREIVGNIILFIPVGQLLANLFRGKHLPLIATIGFLASLAVETTQHRYGLGTFEVADLIHNTIGSVCGYYIYKTDFCLRGQELWNHIRSRFLWR